MAQRHYSSTAAAMQLQGSVNGSAVSLTVDAVVGLPTSYPFTVVIDPGTESEEIVTVTNVAGTTLTVVRGEDGTSGVPHSGGAVIRHMVTARDLREPQQHINADSDVHGVPGLLSQLFPTGSLLPFPGATAPSGFHVADGSSVLRADDPDLFAVIGTTWGEGDDPGNTFALPNLIDRTLVGAGGDYALGATFGADEVTLTTDQMPSHSHTGTAASAGAHGHSASTSANGAHSHSVTLAHVPSVDHIHGANNLYAMISPTSAGNMYFVARSGEVATGSNRINGTYSGATDNRSNWVRVSGTTSASQNPSGALAPSASANSTGAHTHSVTVVAAGAHSHSVTTSPQGGGAPHSNVQRSAAVNWIIKR